MEDKEYKIKEVLIDKIRHEVDDAFLSIRKFRKKTNRSAKISVRKNSKEQHASSSPDIR